ncbi:MAG: 2-dehydro-3-deoxyphosphogluconate aldolase [Chloroflexi bacterium RBG_16_48_8]|nr:MAG: 2-dehydro-3-deoxyphosphogluconate aldolase [Chloroflexi bacterium RBG_16_48_8]
MNKEEVLKRIRELGLLAVIRGPTRDLTLKMVDALVEGGVLGIEITYSTPDAAKVVSALNENYGEKILLGMGTLTSPEQPAEAKAAGARFIVSPHCETELAKAMVQTNLVAMIGAFTPSEFVMAHRLGADIVKIFPGSLGGPGHLKALRGPFPNIPAMPTGGVSIDNVAQWFSAGAVAVGAGSELCPSEWAKEGRFRDITERAKAFVGAVQKARQKS